MKNFGTIQMISIDAKFQINHNKKFWFVIYVCSSNRGL